MIEPAEIMWYDVTKVWLKNEFTEFMFIAPGAGDDQHNPGEMFIQWTGNKRDGMQQQITL